MNVDPDETHSLSCVEPINSTFGDFSKIVRFVTQINLPGHNSSHQFEARKETKRFNSIRINIEAMLATVTVKKHPITNTSIFAIPHILSYSQILGR